jgi:hypothetical protein
VNGAGEGIRTLDPNLGKALALSAKPLMGDIFLVPRCGIAQVLPKLTSISPLRASDARRSPRLIKQDSFAKIVLDSLDFHGE